MAQNLNFGAIACMHEHNYVYISTVTSNKLVYQFWYFLADMTASKIIIAMECI